MKNCPKCASVVKEWDIVCPVCGATLVELAAPKDSIKVKGSLPAWEDFRTGAPRPPQPATPEAQPAATATTLPPQRPRPAGEPGREETPREEALPGKDDGEYDKRLVRAAIRSDVAKGKGINPKALEALGQTSLVGAAPGTGGVIDAPDETPTGEVGGGLARAIAKGAREEGREAADEPEESAEGLIEREETEELQVSQVMEETEEIRVSDIEVHPAAGQGLDSMETVKRPGAVAEEPTQEIATRREEIDESTQEMRTREIRAEEVDELGSGQLFVGDMDEMPTIPMLSGSRIVDFLLQGQPGGQGEYIPRPPRTPAVPVQVPRPFVPTDAPATAGPAGGRPAAPFPFTSVPRGERKKRKRRVPDLPFSPYGSTIITPYGKVRQTTVPPSGPPGAPRAYDPEELRRIMQQAQAAAMQRQLLSREDTISLPLAVMLIAMGTLSIIGLAVIIYLLVNM